LSGGRYMLDGGFLTGPAGAHRIYLPLTLKNR